MSFRFLTAIFLGWGLACGVSGDDIIITPKSPASEPVPRPGVSFMRAKLSAIDQIVEGLAVENYSLISEGGEKLLALSADAAFQTRRDPLYMHYSSVFQTNVNELMNSAKRESLGDATLNYINLTVSCVACHKHVRGAVQVAPVQNAGQGALLR